jgi:hypothetical protein
MAMSVLYTVKEDSATLWCICRDQTYLATRLGMNEAIRQAGQLARDHHRRTGLTVSVEIESREGATLLSRYTKPQPRLDLSDAQRQALAEQEAAEQEAAEQEAALLAAVAAIRESAAA